MTALTTHTSGLLETLFSSAPSPEIPEEDRIYDFLIGSWDLQVVDHLSDGTLRHGTGECHAAWVLEGRAVQDVWICPGVADRSGDLGRLGNRFGTTLRIYDPEERVWRVTWFNPVTGSCNRLTGLRSEADVVQKGRDPYGNFMRWSFRHITADSAEWIGEISSDEGATWTVQTTFSLRRRS